MSITVAKTAGFCFGVNRAVEIVNSLADSKAKVCTLGPIIHNKEMVQELKEKGVFSIDNLNDAVNFETVVIRSHVFLKVSRIPCLKCRVMWLMPLVHLCQKFTASLQKQGRKTKSFSSQVTKITLR